MHDPLSKPGIFLGGFSATLNATRTGLESLNQEIKIFYLSFKTIYDYIPDFAALLIFFSFCASYETPRHSNINFSGQSVLAVATSSFLFNLTFHFFLFILNELNGLGVRYTVLAGKLFPPFIL